MTRKDRERFPRRVTIPVVLEAICICAFWWFDYMYPYTFFFDLLIEIGHMSFATTRVLTNIYWCGVCVNSRMISQGVLSHEFRSVGQRQAQHIWFQNSSPNHISVAQDMLLRLNEAEVNVHWNFKFPPVSSYHHTSSLQA